MAESETILLTVVLKHDQSRNIDALMATLDANGWWERFPPEGVEIVSWTVAMGLGQIVTLRLPPSRLNAVNMEVERGAWGAFSTEFYPSYDFAEIQRRIVARRRASAQAAGKDEA